MKFTQAQPSLLNFIKDKMSLLHRSIFFIEILKFLNNNLITKILSTSLLNRFKS